MQIKNYLWALPFLAFLLGYFTIQKIFQPRGFKTPSIVGKKLQDAIAILSKDQLNIKFLAEKEDSDLPHGTILSQKPISGIGIRPGQSVYVTISRKPDRSSCPDLLNRHVNEINQIAKEKNFKNRVYFLPSNYPNNLCIAQYPNPGSYTKDKNIITYICKTENKPVLFPDFKNKSLTEVLEFLNSNNIKVEISYVKNSDSNNLNENNSSVSELSVNESGESNLEINNSSANKSSENNFNEVKNSENNNDYKKSLEEELDDNSAIVCDQRPLAGSLINIENLKQINVHLKVCKK